MINLARTDPNAAEVVTLYEQHGTSVEGIAEGLDIPVEVVKGILMDGSRIYRKEHEKGTVNPVDRLTPEDVGEVLTHLKMTMRHAEDPHLQTRAAIALLKDARNNYNNRGETHKNSLKFILQNITIHNRKIRKAKTVEEFSSVDVQSQQSLVPA